MTGPFGIAAAAVKAAMVDLQRTTHSKWPDSEMAACYDDLKMRETLHSMRVLRNKLVPRLATDPLDGLM